MSTAAKGLLLALLGYVVVGVVVFGGSFPSDRLFVPMHTERLEPWRSELTPERAAELTDGEFHATSDKLVSFRADDAITINALREGRVPLWNPTNAGGVPHLGQALYGVFYPLHLLYLTLDPERAYVWIALIHHILAALFTFLWLRRIGVGGYGSFIGGLAFGFSTYLLIRAHYYQYVECFAWLPCGLWLVEAITGGRRRLAAAAGLALVTGTVLLSGWPQTAVYTIWAWALLATFRIARAELAAPPHKPIGALLLVTALATGAAMVTDDAGALLVKAFAPWAALALAFLVCGGKGAFLRRLLLPAGAIVVGGLLAMIQYLPAAEWSAFANRQGIGAPESLSMYGLRPRFLLDLALPSFFGAPGFSHQDHTFHLTRLFALESQDVAAGLAGHRGNLVENTVYAGLLALPLALLGLLVRSARRGFLAALLFLSGAFAVGWSAVVYPMFFAGWFVGVDPRRALGVAVFAVCALAGAGAGALARGKASGIGRGLAITLAAVGVAALVAAFGLDPETRLGPLLRHVATLAAELQVDLAIPDDATAAADELVTGVFIRLGAIALTGAAALWLLASKRSLAVPVRFAPLAIVLAIDLVLASRPATASKPRDGFLGSHPLIEHLQETVGTSGRLARYSTLPAGLQNVSFPPNLAGCYGLLDAWCYTVTPPARWMRLCERIDPTGRWNLNGVFVQPLSENAHLASRALDLLGVRAIVGFGELPETLPDGVSLDRQFGSSFVLTNDDALPRVFVVPDAEPRGARTDEQVLDRLHDPSFDPRRTVLVEADTTTLPASTVAPPTATLVEERPESIRIRLDGDSSGSGVLVLNDSWAPGWTATVDGEEAPVWIGNFAVRAVPIPAGAVEVELRYRPTSYTIGRAVSVATFVAILVALVIGWRRREDDPALTSDAPTPSSSEPSSSPA